MIRLQFIAALAVLLSIPTSTIQSSPERRALDNATGGSSSSGSSSTNIAILEVLDRAGPDEADVLVWDRRPSPQAAIDFFNNPNALLTAPRLQTSLRSTPATERRDDDRDRSLQQQQLPPYARIAGDTTNAPVSAGNPNSNCGGTTVSGCINGCRSLYYTVVGTGRDMVASTCDEDAYQSAIHVWEGDSAANLQCANGTYGSTPDL
jgi:hypothetical protein